jgi:hypothetical protein
VIAGFGVVGGLWKGKLGGLRVDICGVRECELPAIRLDCKVLKEFELWENGKDTHYLVSFLEELINILRSFPTLHHRLRIILLESFIEVNCDICHLDMI